MSLEPTTNTVIAQTFLAAVNEKYDVSETVFLIDRLYPLQAACHRTGCDFRCETHGNRNAVERIFRGMKRRTICFLDLIQQRHSRNADDWISPLRYAWLTENIKTSLVSSLFVQTVALPIETKVREYYGKLWLSLNLAERGYRSVIGPTYEIKTTLDKTNPDIYLSKDPGDGNIEFFDNLRSSGVIVCGLDTEGNIAASMDRYSTNKKNVLHHLDSLFTWGPIHKEELKRQYDKLDNVYVTGSPRFDLLYYPLNKVYDNEKEKIQEKYGDYILFTSSFANANPFDHEQYKQKTIEVWGEFDIEKTSHILRNYYLYLELLIYIQNKSPTYSIILRPHPGENHTVYNKIDDWYDNVYVEHDGDVRPWILGAETVIHFNCTTGVESALMETPAISYEPIKEGKNDKFLPQIISKSVSNPNDVQTHLNNWTNSDNKYELNERQKSNAIQYFGELDISAAANICDIFDELIRDSDKEKSKLRPDILKRIERSVRVTKLSSPVKKFYHMMKKNVYSNHPDKTNKKAGQKFPGLDKEEVKNDVKKFEHMMGRNEVYVEKVPYTNNSYFISYE